MGACCGFFFWAGRRGLSKGTSSTPAVAYVITDARRRGLTRGHGHAGARVPASARRAGQGRHPPAHGGADTWFRGITSGDRGRGSGHGLSGRPGGPIMGGGGGVGGGGQGPTGRPSGAAPGVGAPPGRALTPDAKAPSGVGRARGRVEGPGSIRRRACCWPFGLRAGVGRSPKGAVRGNRWPSRSPSARARGRSLTAEMGCRCPPLPGLTRKGWRRGRCRSKRCETSTPGGEARAAWETGTTAYGAHGSSHRLRSFRGRFRRRLGTPRASSAPSPAAAFTHRRSPPRPGRKSRRRKGPAREGLRRSRAEALRRHRA